MSVGTVLSRLFGAGSSPDRRIPLDALAGWTLVVCEEVKIWAEYQKRARKNAHVYVGDAGHARGFCDPNTKEIVVRFAGLSSTDPDGEVLFHELGHALGIMSHE